MSEERCLARLLELESDNDILLKENLELKKTIDELSKENEGLRRSNDRLIITLNSYESN